MGRSNAPTRWIPVNETFASVMPCLLEIIPTLRPFLFKTTMCFGQLLAGIQKTSITNVTTLVSLSLKKRFSPYFAIFVNFRLTLS